MVSPQVPSVAAPGSGPENASVSPRQALGGAPIAEVDLEAARSFLDLACAAHKAGDRGRFLAARRMMMLALGLVADGGPPMRR